MLQQGGNQVVDYIRVFADNHTILRFGLPQRASVQQERAVADRGDRLSMAVSLIEKMDGQVRVPVECDHGFRWKLITQFGGT